MVKKPKLSTISILGCGWFGLALAKELHALGYSVKGSTTTENKLEYLTNQHIKAYLLNISTEEAFISTDFFECDILLISIPPKRNSSDFLDYPSKIKQIIAAAKNKSKRIIFISSTSVYGDNNKIVDENSPRHADTPSGKLMTETEALILKEELSTIIRFAGLFGPERNPGRFFAGKKDVPNGNSPVNLIHQIDAIGIALAIIEQEAFGKIYNACAPQHPSRKEFYTAAALNAGLEVPQFIEENKTWKIVNSVNVPQYLNYNFKYKI